MKYLLIILFPFLLSAQNIWYVDRDATGANTGRSWTDAWTSLDSSVWMGYNGVNWAIIGDGDTIYVSGGTDSTRYIPTGNSNYACGIRRETSEGETHETFTTPVVIAPAWHANHNGDVYYTPSDDVVGTSVYATITSISAGTPNYTGDTITVSGSLSGTNDFYRFYYWHNLTTGAYSWVSQYWGGTQRFILNTNGLTQSAGDVICLTLVSSSYMIFSVSGVNNVEITGMNFVDTRSDSMHQQNGLMSLYGSDVTIKNSYIFNRGLTTGTYFEGSNLSLIDNFFDYEVNALDNGIDPIGASGGNGSGTHLIDGNIILIRNISQTTTSHRDGIQIADCGVDGVNSNTLDIVIRNNTVIVAGAGTNWNGMVYTDRNKTNVNWYIYNNLFVANNTTSNIGGLFMYQGFKPPEYVEWSLSAYVFNNTMIMNDDGTGLSLPIGIEDTDTLYYKNNLVVMDAPINTMLRTTHFYYGEYYRRFDYNGWFEYGGLSGTFYNGEGFGSYSYAQWTDPANFSNNDQYDANSITGNSTSVTFAEKYGEDIADYYTETGRDLGTDIGADRPDLLAKFPDIEYDILGNPRTGTWDIGALEFQSGAVDTVPTFSFTPVTGATRSQTYTATAVFLNADSTFNVSTTTGANFKIGALGSYATTTVTADSGDTVYVQNTASGSYSILNRETIVAGGVSANFDVTTEAEPYVPPVSSGGIVKGSNGILIKDSTGKPIRTTQ